MRSVKLICLTLLGIALQAMLFPQLQISGAQPDAFLLVTVFIALQYGWFEAVVCGAVGGLMLDALLTGSIGPYALLYTAVAILAGGFHNRMEGGFTAILKAAGVSVLCYFLRQVFTLVVAYFSGVGVPMARVFTQAVLPGTLYHAAVSLVWFTIFWFKKMRTHKKHTWQATRFYGRKRG